MDIDMSRPRGGPITAHDGRGVAADSHDSSHSHRSQFAMRSLSFDQASHAAIVVIAEDEQQIAEIIATVVAEAGYKPLVGAHGRQALALARAHQPALLITDLTMPYLTGAELISTLRGDAESSGRAMIPVILVTAAGAAQARAAGADAVVRKPFSLDDLENYLHRFLDTASA